MKAAPGAQLPIEDIFGRDPFIASLWGVLDSNSVRMEAERRIGKTSILHKMEAAPPPGWEVVSLDLEQVHSAAEFAEKVCEKVHERLSGWKKQGRRVLNFLGLLGGGELGPLKFPEKKHHPDGYWKKLLTGAVEDLVEQQAAAGKRVVFFFDEMPWMLAAIADPAPRWRANCNGSARRVALPPPVPNDRPGLSDGAVRIDWPAPRPPRSQRTGLQKSACERHETRRGPAPGRAGSDRPGCPAACGRGLDERSRRACDHRCGDRRLPLLHSLGCIRAPDKRPARDIRQHRPGVEQTAYRRSRSVQPLPLPGSESTATIQRKTKTCPRPARSCRQEQDPARPGQNSSTWRRRQGAIDDDRKVRLTSAAGCGPLPDLAIRTATTRSGTFCSAAGGSSDEGSRDDRPRIRLSVQPRLRTDLGGAGAVLYPAAPAGGW